MLFLGAVADVIVSGARNDLTGALPPLRDLGACGVRWVGCQDAACCPECGEDRLGDLRDDHGGRA